ncbi:uncharacterized protein HD556DRAFT_1447195 [Suillus plorans]|uniref:Uncharacterized protein n=1 Tax=Suillus plorans TaxID=116603 RepID=A0A9P7AGS4_9AGAM|nr:uncharacterized protein HD556DRAFT_1447194 [Suillus plorans]XP_041156252.1 uncharacterized protein HD556DRAFT_1447195 [Suillus plorans]KAG1789130.1 hypothetical protein HD556DRAFT_1447194 [Suillus plorans]KAG1789131.1 hypothetical protein HD556DRAFT_1447195 [Suillus plorans]
MSNIRLPSSPTQNLTRTWRMPANASIPSTPKAIYQHIREIDGICGALDQPQFDDTPLPSFSPVADWYLQAHGYTSKALLHIACAHDTSSSCQDFVMAIATKGMPIAEAVFLWGLITSDDRVADNE